MKRLNRVKSKNSTLRWLYNVPGRKKGYLLILTLVQTIHGASGVLYALLLRNIVDSAVKQNREMFWQGVIGIGLLVAGRIILETVSRWLSELTRATFENIFKQRETGYILRKDYASIRAIHTGEWMNRLTNDTAVVANGYVETIPRFAGMAVQMISALVMLIVLSPSFSSILLPGGCLVLLFAYVLLKKLRKLHKRMQEKDGIVRIFLQERISSLMIIKSFVAEGVTLAEAKEKMKDHLRARMANNRVSNFGNTGLAVSIEGMYLLGVAYCSWGILTGQVSYGTLTAVMQLLGQLQKPFANISGYLPKYYAMLASAERLMEVERLAEDHPGEPASRERTEVLYNETLTAFGLYHASYSYYPTGQGVTGMSKDNMPVVLHDLTLEIIKGEYVAFTGPSGCGKSTILKLLMSMYPLDAGTKGIRCKDGSIIPLTAEYRRLFAYVPQGNQLMTGTIREIVSFAEKDKADEQRIMQALRIACASDFVDELENGIDTQLGERGAGLSEGQMQRIAIARAIYTGAPVLLLDEATSALDAVVAKKMLSNLRELTDKTVVIVTHQVDAMEICNRVIRFTEDGISEA